MATPLGIDSESESHQEVRADSTGRFDHNWRRHVDDLADPLLLRHAHGHPCDWLVRERSLRRDTRRGRSDQPGPLPAKG